MEPRTVAVAGSLAANRDVQGGGPEVAVEEAEVIGGIDDRGIAPVDDAGHRPRGGVDEDCSIPRSLWALSRSEVELLLAREDITLRESTRRRLCLGGRCQKRSER